MKEPVADNGEEAPHLAMCVDTGERIYANAQRR